MIKPIYIWVALFLISALSIWQYLTWYQAQKAEFGWRIEQKEWDFQDKKKQESLGQDNKRKENDSLQKEIKQLSYLKEADMNEVVVYELIEFGLKYLKKENIDFEKAIVDLPNASYDCNEWINNNEGGYDFVRKKNFIGLERSEYINKHADSHWLQAYLMKNFDIKSFYNKYKHLLFMQLTDNLYKKELADYVDDLIEVYDYMKKIPDSEDYYKQFNKNNKILSTKPMLDEKLLSRYKNYENGAVNFYLFWLHSFWGRRYDEGHREDVHYVLIDIRNHYR